MQTRGLTLEGENLSLDLELEKTDESGRKIYRVKGVGHAERGRLPGIPAQLFAPWSFRSTSTPAPVPEGTEERARKDSWMVEGIASSTSVDWYGTEMDRNALEGMARQFTAGVSLIPRHNGWLSAVEWDEVIGLTVEATVRAVDEVAKAADPTEQGYTLAIKAKLFPEEEKAQALQRRLSAEQPIGLSIGGWFTDVRVVTAPDSDEVERIIVLSVELDHLAVTRAPANPDSHGLHLLRSLTEKAVQGLRVRSAAEAAEAPAPSEPASIPASEPTPDPEPIPASLSAETTGSSPNEGNPVEEVDEQTSTDEDGSVDGARTSPTPTPEDTMTPEQLRAILGETLAPIQAEINALKAERATPAPAPAATPTPDAPAEARGGTPEIPASIQARLDELEARNRVLASRVQDLAGAKTARRSLVPDHAYAPGNHGDGSQYRSLVELARQEGRAVAVAEVSERHAWIFAADRYDPKVTRSHLETALRSLIDGAIADGLIKDPTATPAWS